MSMFVNKCVVTNISNNCRLNSPVIGLDRLRVRNLGPLIPVIWLGVVWIVDLFSGVDWWHHVVQQVTVAHFGLVDKHLIAVVWVQD